MGTTINGQYLTSRTTGRAETLTGHPQAARFPLQGASTSRQRMGTEQIREGDEGGHREGDKGEEANNRQVRHRYLIVADHIQPLQAKLPGSYRS